MELCLNALWFVVSLLLVSGWMRDARVRGAALDWRAGVAVAMLVLLLFPVISMTDDLLLASAPPETEHMLRRVEVAGELGMVLVPAALLVLAVAAAAGMLLRRGDTTRSLLRPRRLREVFVRAVGVRPPPMMQLAASL